MQPSNEGPEETEHLPNLFLLPFSISITFHDEKDDSTKTVQVPIGQSLLEAAHANDVDLEGAAKSRSQVPCAERQCMASHFVTV